ncbi:MAG: RsbRD N-terminal domain-containing protein [Desulfobacterales bacterium]
MGEGLFDRIAKDRAALLSRWFDAAVEAYAPDTASFLKDRSDPFANPVGSRTRRGLETLFDQLVGGMDPEAVSRGLDPILRVRAVQNLSPARAVGFVFALKRILLERFEGSASTEDRRQISELHERIDRLALAAFDLYMACREQVMELKANEMRLRTFRAFQRAGLVRPEHEQPSSEAEE